MKSPEAGLKPKDRKLATTTKGKQLTANQWQNTPQQVEFMQYWTDPGSATFGNAYKSALRANYSEHYARQIVSLGSQWIQDYNRLSKLELQHIEQKLINIINGEITRQQSNSPEDTRLKAIEMYGKFTGKLNDKNQINVNIVQPILGGAAAKTNRSDVVDV